ncbi:unnamed protein product, partial [marine sediment metagenome]
GALGLPKLHLISITPENSGNSILEDATTAQEMDLDKGLLIVNNAGRWLGALDGSAIETAWAPQVRMKDAFTIECEYYSRHGSNKPTGMAVLEFPMRKTVHKMEATITVAGPDGTQGETVVSTAYPEGSVPIINAAPGIWSTSDGGWMSWMYVSQIVDANGDFKVKWQGNSGDPVLWVQVVEP